MAQDLAPSRPGGLEGLAQPPFDAPRLGRYTSILLSVLGMMIFGFGIAFVSSLHQYLFFRFGVSQALVGFYINSVSLGEARPLRVRGSSGRRRTGCVGVRCTSLQNRVATRSPWRWRKEPPLQAAWRCGESVPRRPSTPILQPHRLAPAHSPLRSPDTPAWLMFVGP